MIYLKKYWPLILIILIILCCYRALQLNPRDVPSARIGQEIPNVSLKAYHDQELVNLHHLIGKPRVIHFWASWCDNCVQELLLLKTWQQENHQDIIGVNYKESPTALAQFLSLQENIFKPLLLDENAQFGLEMGVVAVPETFVMDAKGKIVYRHQGPLTKSDLSVIRGKLNG
jgi:cytochrome c biogenesis protein CcmG/thiol:disulfide interchange protein DsbE